MRAHRTRRALWLSNAPLLLAMLGVAAWYLTDVRPAVSAVVDAPRSDPGAAVKDIVRTFDRAAREANAATLLPPVEAPEIEGTYRFEHFQAMLPAHAIFSGSRPSNQLKPADDPPPARDFDINTHGSVTMVVHVPPLHGALTFAFKGGKRTVVILVGESLVLPGDDRCELLSIRKLGRHVYDTLWSVPFGKGSTLQTVRLDNRKIPRPDDPVRPLDPDAGPAPEAHAAVHRIGTVAKLIARGHYALEFNAGASEWVRSGAARKAPETIKTGIAKGAVLGVRLVDFGDAPLDRLRLKRNDTLVSIDGQPATSRADVIRIAEALSPETTGVQVVIDRYGRRITFDVDPRDPKTRRAMAQQAARQDR